MKKTATILIILMGLGLCSCGLFGPRDPALEALRQTPEYKKAERYLADKRSDDSIYWGMGMANIRDDLGQGKIKARKRAINDLAEQIRVQVTSDVAMTVNKKSSNGESGYSEAVKQSFESKLETYTNQVLTNLKESRIFIDYPKAGTGTYLVYVSKKEYDEMVKKDLARKKQMVTGTIRNGDRDFKAGTFMGGLSQYIQAKTMLISFFGIIPVYDDIEGTGTSEDLSMALSKRVRGFFRRLSVSLLNSDFQYDIQGVLETTPRIFAQYRDASGKSHPVTGMPLAVSFALGNGEAPTVITGNYGEADVSFSRLSPETRDISVKLSLERKAFPGLERFVLNDPAGLAITLHRKKTVGLAFHFLNNGKSVSPRNLKEDITTAILSKNYAVLDLPFRTEADIIKSSGLNADHVFLITVKATGGGTVGRYSSMFTSTCGASLKMYSLPLKTLAFSETVSPAQGFGVSQDSAGWDGFGKIKGNILKQAELMIGKIR